METSSLAPVAEGTARAEGKTGPERANYTALLADLAVLLREHPGIPLPHLQDYGSEIHFNIFGDGAAETIAAARRAIGGKWDKKPRENQHGAYFDFTREWHGWQVILTTSRDEVCRRVATGTREVTTLIPDPEALAKVPQIEHTETEETYEWVCEPVLAPRPLAETAPKAVAAA
jgi:hypothetical protein